MLKSVVKLPCGTIISVADLPKTWRIHWTIYDKWVVANAVRFGVMAFDMACAKYLMHPDELNKWIEGARDGTLYKTKYHRVRVTR